jgi:large subunit ribosomal protein L21
MYAIIRTGGKQYQVAQGDQLRVEKINGEIGETVEINDVLMVVDGETVSVGTPQLENASVKIAEQGKAKKIDIFKKKKRKGYRLKKGHRQQYTALTIEEISA